MRAGCALLVALLGVPGCLGGSRGRPAGETCSGDDECAEGLHCSYGRCRDECDFDRDCAEGLSCVEAPGEGGLRVCVAPEGTGEGCGEVGTQGTCPDELICGADGACHEGCSTDEDCAGERRCVDGACLEPDAVPPECTEDEEVPHPEAVAMRAPAVAYSPAGWGIAWTQQVATTGGWVTRFTLASPDGLTFQDPFPLVDQDDEIGRPSIAWTGAGFVVGCVESAGAWGQVYYLEGDPPEMASELDPPGGLFGGPISVAGDGTSLVAAWTEGSSGQPLVRVAEWAEAALSLGNTWDVSCLWDTCSEPSITPSPEEGRWVVALRSRSGDDARNTLLVVGLGPPPLTEWGVGRVSDELDARAPDVVAVHDGYAIAWVEGDDEAPVARFGHILPSLADPEPRSPLGADAVLRLPVVRLAWDGETYAIAWHGELAGTPGIYASRSTDPAAEGWPSSLVSADAIEPGAPDLDGSAGEWGVLWWTDRQPGPAGLAPQLLFNRGRSCD